MLAQLNKARGFTSYCKNAIRSLVPILMALRRPNDILREVAKTIIRSLDCPSRLSFTHVCEEVFKRLFPPLANLNSTTSIEMEIYCLGIETPVFHRCPNSVNALFVTARMAVSGEQLPDCISQEAPA